MQFVGAGQSLGSTSSANQMLFTATPTLTGSGSNGILPYATVVSSSGQVDLATTSGSALLAFANYATNINTAAAGSDVLVSGTNVTQTLTSSQSLNAILIRGSNDTITSSAGVTLTLTSGALVTGGGGTGNTFSVSTLALGSVEGIINTSADLTLSSVVTGTAVYGLTKAGPNTLTLAGSGTSTFSGATQITQGVVNVQNGGAAGQPPATLSSKFPSPTRAPAVLFISASTARNPPAFLIPHRRRRSPATWMPSQPLAALAARLQ